MVTSQNQNGRKSRLNSNTVHAIIIFDEMQNGAIWGHFRVSYNIESSTMLMTDGQEYLKIVKNVPFVSWQIRTLLLCTTLDSVYPVIYPSIDTILCVLLNMPAASATAKMSFSVLRRLKTCVSSAMKNDRLSSLGLVHIQGGSSGYIGTGPGEPRKGP
jgi:hypothetical protein